MSSRFTGSGVGMTYPPGAARTRISMSHGAAARGRARDRRATTNQLNRSYAGTAGGRGVEAL